MTVFQIIAALLTLTAGFAWVNQRFVGLPIAIGVMLIALVVSLVLVLLPANALITGNGKRILAHVNFNQALLDGMLGALLFAGALQVDLGDLKREAGVVALLVTASLLASTLLVGGLMWVFFTALGLDVALVYCFLFGALISPTDPIAVLAILRRAGVPKELETQFTGESLFNDGVAIVIFLTLVGFLSGGSGEGVTVGHVVLLFAREALGGIAFGLALGAVAYALLKSIDAHHVEIMVTLALVTGGYACADALHLSGPLAIVVAGLLMGNQGRLLAMSAHTREHLDTFWELIDEILNAVLFVLIGLEILVIDFSLADLAAGLLAIPTLLGARLLAVGLPVTALRRFQDFAPHTVKILTWGGLRGGISIALALSLPSGTERDILVSVTYVVVVFSIGVQGLTIGRVARLATGPSRG